MRLYWELGKLAFQRQLTYRAANLAGLVTNFFFGLLRAAVMIALYGGRAEAGGITLQGAVTYTGFSQGLIALLALFSWFDVADSVYSGEIAGDLLKPASYQGSWLARDLGRALAALIVRG